MKTMSEIHLIGSSPLPHNQESEAGLLSCILQDPETCADFILALDESDFYVPGHRSIYKACKTLAARSDAIDYVTVCTELEAAGILNQLGGDAFIMNIMQIVPTTANAESYLNAVERLGRSRRLIGLCGELTESAYDSPLGDDFNALMERAEREILNLARTSQSDHIKTTNEAIDGAYKAITGILNDDVMYCGYPTRFRTIDNIIMGVKPGEMIIIGARPSIGKTALGGCLAKNWAMAGHSVYFGSLEMKAEQLMMRLIFGEGGIHMNDIKTGVFDRGDFENTIKQAGEMMRDRPIVWDDSSREWSGIKRRIRKEVTQNDCKIAIIDYLQLITVTSAGGKKFFNRESEVAHISGEIKALALDLNIPLIVLAQLNRDAEGRPPRMKDLRESGSLEQDADQIWLLHRERPENDEDTNHLIAQGFPLQAQLIIEKNRNGPTGIAPLDFYPQYTRFDDPRRIDDGDIPPL